MDEYNNRPLMDELIKSRELQMLKTMIPYMHESQQKTLAMAVRFIEFIKTTALFEENTVFAQELQACSGESQQDRMRKMLIAIRDYCNDNEKEQIDMIINFYEV